MSHYQQPVRRTGRSISVIRFEPVQGLDEQTRVKLEASRVSANQKLKNFSSMGFEAKDVHLPHNVDPERFHEELLKANEDPNSLGIIVQFPPPRTLLPYVQEIDPHKDIDGLLGARSQQRACATADGITRVALPYARDGAEVSVIGSNGFVGSGVVRLLNDQGIEPVCLDYGDDLSRARQSDVIISVTGSPGIIGGDIIAGHHRAVIDSGFVPREDGTVQGDVRHDAYNIPQRITPVPGGIGPVEMAVLIERGVQAEVDPQLKSWSYDGNAVTVGQRVGPGSGEQSRERITVGSRLGGELKEPSESRNTQGKSPSGMSRAARIAQRGQLPSGMSRAARIAQRGQLPSGRGSQNTGSTPGPSSDSPRGDGGMER
ncbi:tetrahydrofolate dehydrogenase/cyclohydrolase catalytic domain-containing protein [Nocardiopsis sp. NPDC049922]|uniref:tetrahydrofolate dehydrogenase/cyclohydrolase catalytic domain-containing protein n=1 Tax=Nocardiopsis sp. NPDC049922 TaxID=3155157 RepID=UPI0033CABBD6